MTLPGKMFIYTVPKPGQSEFLKELHPLADKHRQPNHGECNCGNPFFVNTAAAVYLSILAAKLLFLKVGVLCVLVALTF